MKRIFLALPLLVLFGCEFDRKPEVTYLQMPGTAELDLPFSSAVRVGNTLYRPAIWVLSLI